MDLSEHADKLTEVANESLECRVRLQRITQQVRVRTSVTKRSVVEWWAKVSQAEYDNNLKELGHDNIV